MSQAEHDQRVDYVELPAQDLAASKAFYQAVFGCHRPGRNELAVWSDR